MCGRTPDNHHDLLDINAGRSGGRYPSLAAADSPLLIVFELATPTLYCEPAVLYQRVSSYSTPPQLIDSIVTPHPIWGEDSFLYFHNRHTGNAQYYCTQT